MKDDIISQWANNETCVESPWLAYISITNICNNRCNFCAHPNSMRAEKGIMGLELFKKIVNQLPDSVKKIYLQKQGEPFLNKYLPLLVKYLKKKRPDIHISLHTNCTVIKSKTSREVVKYIDSMGVSVSAISSKIYKKVHGKDRFSAVKENLNKLSKIVLELPGAERPHVFVDYVRCNDNSSEEEEKVVQFYKDNFPGISSVDFHGLYNFQGEIEEGNLDIYQKLPHNKFPCCVFPWSSITFCHDGLVSYCFVEPRESLFLGDIKNQSFSEIWNGEKYQMFRKMMAEKRFSKLSEHEFYCHKCSWLWSMHSQSPKNLKYGYSNNHNKRHDYVKFSDLLNLPNDKIFETGADYYLNGEIHLAIGCFEYLLIDRSKNESLIRETNVMIDKCKRVLAKYEHLTQWQEILGKEGKVTDNNFNKYCHIGDN